MHKHIIGAVLALALLTGAQSEDDNWAIDRDQRQQVKTWLVALAVKAAPPERSRRPPGGPHAAETPEQRLERYGDIAEDIIAVVFDKRNPPIAGMSRLQSAGFTLAMAIGESGLAPDVDLGPCYRGGVYRTACDGGLAVGILQVQIPPPLQAPFWADRRKLIAKAVRGLSGSLGACASLPVQERLAAYGAGSCSSVVGQRVSRKRWTLIERVLAGAVPPQL